MTFHWVTGGFDESGTPTFNSNVYTNLTVPAGGILKKILVRQTGVHMFLAGTDHSAIVPFELQISAKFVGGVWDGRELFAATYDVPLETNAFEAAGVAVYQSVWHGGDREFGYNRKADYAIGSAADANVQFTAALFSSFSFFSNPNGDWHMGYKIGYTL